MSESDYSEDSCYLYESDDDLDKTDDDIIESKEDIVKSIEILSLESNYKILKLNELYNEINNIIIDLQYKINYSYDKILNLLLKYNWNTEKLYNLYLEDHISINNIEDSIDDSVCSICYDTLDKTNLIQINDCNHILCKECFINNYSININLKCPMYKCNNLCYLSTILLYIDDIKCNDASRRSIKELYKKYIIDDYINVNKLIIYCPSIPYCGNVIIRDLYSDLLIIKCNCGNNICFGCKEISESHEPSTCLMLKKWNKLIIDESISYINSKCKECPWCNRICEKVSGCNFLTCLTIKNKYWCWLCGDKVYYTDHDYTSIRGHTCTVNNSNLEVDTNNKNIIKKFSVKLYNKHNNSLTFDNKNKKSIIDIINEKVSDDLIKLIKESYDILIKSRNLIINTGIYSYYEYDNIDEININLLLHKIELFEYILEFYSMALDKYINMIKNDVINNNIKYYYIDKLCNNYIDLKNKTYLINKNIQQLYDFIYSFE